MITIPELLEKIRERPESFLDRASARSLYSFLSGFTYARKDAGFDDFQWLGGFGDYVYRRFEISSVPGWAAMIEFYSPTEADEMSLFWQLWDEYLAQRQLGQTA
jgi:hypothetical protein